MNSRSALTNRVSQYIQSHNLLEKGDTVIVGSSGGIDSTALLHILSSLDMDLTLIAVYIDHGLRPHEIGAERHFIEQLSGKLRIKAVIRDVDVNGYKRDNGLSTEEAARILRYKTLHDIRKEYSNGVIAVAHTADDQVEEFFIRLIRGSGMKGLSGMSCRHGNIIRPLLAEHKATLIHYLKDIGQNTCHDSSNDSMSYLRNAVRLDLLPKLEKEYNPSLRDTILQEMSILRHDEEYLDSICENRFHHLCSLVYTDSRQEELMELQLPCKDFILEHLSIQRRVLEKVCWSFGAKPSFQKIEQLRYLAAAGKNGSKMHLSEGLRCIREQAQLVFTYPKGKKRYRGEGLPDVLNVRIIETTGRVKVPELQSTLNLTVTDDADLSGLPHGTLALDADKVHFPLTLRPPLPGEKMRASGAPGRKKILRILQDMKIPSGKRNKYPVLADNEGPVALVGARIGERVKISAETQQILLLQWEKTQQ